MGKRGPAKGSRFSRKEYPCPDCRVPVVSANGLKRCEECAAKVRTERYRAAWADPEKRNKQIVAHKAWRQGPKGAAWTKRDDVRRDRRDRQLKKDYGISLDEFEARSVAQGGVCLFSWCSATNLVVDHDHATGEVRGLLCRQHNAALGKFQDSPLALREAMVYLGDTDS